MSIKLLSLFINLQTIISAGFGLWLAIPAPAFAQSPDHATAGIPFFTGTWAELLDKAQAANKPIFVDCYTTWCGPCKWMDKNVFPTDSAGAFYGHRFICYRLDMEKDEGPEIARQYSVRYYPTFLYLDGQGNLLHRAKGRQPVADFIQTGQTALNPQKRLGTLQQQYDSGDRSRPFLLRYASMMAAAGMAEQARSVAMSYFDQIEPEALADSANFELLYEIVPGIGSAPFRYLFENVDTLTALHKWKASVLVNKSISAAIEEAGKNQDELLFAHALGLRLLDAEKPERAIISAKKDYYYAARQWEQWAAIAIEYMDRGYWRSKMSRKRAREKLPAIYEEIVEARAPMAISTASS